MMSLPDSFAAGNIMPRARTGNDGGVDGRVVALALRQEDVDLWLRARSSVGTAHDERIVGLQRHKDDLGARLLHQVEPVVKELAKEHEPQVERSRQALVRRNVVERALGDIVCCLRCRPLRPSPG